MTINADTVITSSRIQPETIAEHNQKT